MTTKNPYNQIKEILEKYNKDKAWKDISNSHMDYIDAEVMQIVRNDLYLKFIYMLGMREQLQFKKMDIAEDFQKATKMCKDVLVKGVNNEQG